MHLAQFLSLKKKRDMLQEIQIVFLIWEAYSSCPDFDSMPW
jgi:hypothetical protein